MGKKNDAITPSQRALQSQIAKAVYEGMRLRGGGHGGGGGAKADWDCSHCGTKSNWASRTSCRACQRNRTYDRGAATTTYKDIASGSTVGNGGGKNDGKARNTWKSITSPLGAPRGNAQGDGGGGTSNKPAAKRDDQPADGASGAGNDTPATPQPQREQGGKGEDDAIAEARRAVRGDELILNILRDEQGLPEGDKRVVEAVASLAASKKKLEAALSASPPPRIGTLHGGAKSGSRQARRREGVRCR